MQFGINKHEQIFSKANKIVVQIVFQFSSL